MNVRDDTLIIGAIIVSVLVFASAKLFAADLRPSSVDIELDHTSHASQHLGPDRTNYGYDAAMLAVRWDFGRFHLTVADGSVLESCNGQWCGGLWGPREVFMARASLSLWAK